MQIIFGTIAAVLVFLYGCFSAFLNFLFPNTEVRDIRQNLDMNIKPYYIEFSEDTHGWFGEGEKIIIFRPNPEQIEKIETEWQKTPIDSGIAPLIFPETEYNENKVELRKNIPDSEGYWFYKNRGNFSNGYSYNFSFALFDGEKVYYYELDT